MNFGKPIPLLAAALMLLAGAFMAGMGLGERQTGVKVAALAEQMASFEDRQTRLQQGHMGSSPRRYAAWAANPGYPPRERAPETEMSGEEVAHHMLSEQQQLDDAFTEENLDPTWSGATRSTVEDVIVKIASEPGAPTPVATTVDCRSRTCRIVLNLADSGESGQITDNLMADLSAILPQATIVQLPASNDRIDVYVYAQTRTASKS